MKWKASSILFLLATLLCNKTNAQDLFGFKKVEGLKSNVVYCVMQDSKGYIWVGTEGGASRYDGYGFANFTKDDGLTDNDVFQIHEDKKGRLWFLTYSGEPTIYDHGKILTPTNTAFLSKIKPGIMARSLIQYGDSIWYVTMYTAYLFVHDELKKELSVNDIFKNANNTFMEVLSYEKEPVLITNSGLYYPLTGKAIPMAKRYDQMMAAQKVLYINGELLSTNAGFLSVYNFKDSTLKKPFRLPARWPLAIFKSKDEGCVMLLAENMLYKYNPSTGELTKELSLNIPYADYLLIDRDSNVWVSSLNQGLFFKQPSAVHRFDFNTKLHTKTAYSLGKYGRNIYAGFINGEYMEWSNGKASMLQSVPSDLGKVYGFYQKQNKFFALAGYDIYDVFSKQSIKSIGSVKTICANATNFYIGYSFSVKKMPVDAFEHQHYLDPGYDKNTVYNKRVNAMLAVGNDSIFLCGLDGLKLLVKDKITAFANQQLDIFSTGITRIIKGNDGQFVCSSTGKGIAVFDGQHCWAIDKSKGLASNVCNSVFSDKRNIIWAATDKGISKVLYTINRDGISCKVKNYSTADGIPSNVVNDVLVHADTVWVATDNGVCFFREDQMQKGHLAPNIVIEGLFVNTKPVDAEKHVLLHYKENNIRIDFTGLSYTTQSYLQYRYKLEGADTGWNYTTARRIEYSNLSHGRYVFLVTAANANGEWNGIVQRIEFDIAAPFWKTLWFVLLMLMLISGIAFLLIKSRISSIHKKHFLESNALQLQKEKAEFEKENMAYEKQLIELEQKALKLQMNPHFVFNALNAIKGFYAANNKAEADEYIDGFASLMRMMLQKNAKEKIPLHDEIEMLKTYLQLSNSKQDKKFTFDIQVQEQVNIWKLHLPPMLLQPFVENAVIHGVAATIYQGHISVSFSLQNGMLLCEITDNGIGRQQSKEINRFRLHQSQGIAITKQRLQLLSEKSKLTIEDVRKDNACIIGTKVTVLLPLLYKD